MSQSKIDESTPRTNGGGREAHCVSDKMHHWLIARFPNKCQIALAAIVNDLIMQKLEVRTWLSLGFLCVVYQVQNPKLHKQMRQ